MARGLRLEVGAFGAARDMSTVTINAALTLPLRELSFVCDRASGPGGQHVNKVSTRVVLMFDVQSSPTLTTEQKQRIQERLSTRINKRGVMRVVSQRHRSQLANREASLERFVELLRAALSRPTYRKPTRVSKAKRVERMEDKRRRAKLKRNRRTVDMD